MSNNITIADFIKPKSEKKTKKKEVTKTETASTEESKIERVSFMNQIELMRKRNGKLELSNLPQSYCSQIVNAQIEDMIQLLLEDLTKFQKRTIKLHPLKAKSKKRLVFGFNEVKKCIAKCRGIVMAKNIEPQVIKTGVLDEIKRMALKLNIPIIYGLSRSKLGKLLCSHISIGIVGIISLEGGLEKFNQLVELQQELQVKWKSHFLNFSENERNENVLWLSCHYGFEFIIKSCLGCSKIEQIDCINGYSPLLVACSKGHVGIIEILLENGADIDYCSFKKESVALLCSRSNLESFRLIVEKKKEKLKNTKLLIQWIERKDFGNNSPFWELIKTGKNPEILDYLLSLSEFDDSKKALEILSMNPNGNRSLQVILKYIKNPLENINEHGETPFILAIKADARYNVLEWKKIIERNKENISYVMKCDLNGKNALNYAQDSKDTQMKGILNGIIRKLNEQ